MSKSRNDRDRGGNVPGGRSRNRGDGVEELRVPPFSVPAEQGVIGSLVKDSDAWDKVADLLTDADFYRDGHRLIFQGIQALVDAGAKLDAITLSEWLARQGWLDECGGLAYLATLANETPSAANIAAYAEIVREKSLQRQLIGAGREIADLAFFPNMRPTQQLLDEAEAAVFRIAERHAKGRRGPIPAKDIANGMLDKLDQAFQAGGTITGRPTGYPELDAKLLGLQPGDLIVLAARPSMGKTTFALGLADTVALSQRLPVVIFSLEMSSPSLMLKSLGRMAKVELGRLRCGKIEPGEWGTLVAMTQQLIESPMYYDDEGGLSIWEIRGRARRTARKAGPLGLVVVDYMQMVSSGGQEENENLVLAAVSRGLKTLAKELDCPVLALSQLNRSLEKRPNKRPIMSDLRGSGSIEQDADTILFLYRDEVYNPDSADRGVAEVIIGKQRNGETGTVRLRFNGQFSEFANFDGPSNVHPDDPGPGSADW